MSAPTATREPWGTSSGHAHQPPTAIERCRLTAPGLSIEVITYGAHLVRVEVPDKAGTVDNVVLELPDLAAYEDADRNPSIGAIVGRFGNRIAAGSFELDGQRYQLDTNLPPNHLHGGQTGFGRSAWMVVSLEASGDAAELVLEFVSPDGHEGYPGEVTAQATYRVESHRLTMSYTATTTAPTPINLTNHAYWNLAGAERAKSANEGLTVEGHILQVMADRFVVVDQSAIPTGELADVTNTTMDLRIPTQLSIPIEGQSGFDHCWVIDGDPTQPFASVSEASSGRSMLVSTDQPGVQVYTGNFLGGEFPPHGALCLETQHLPDSPNQPTFPSTILRPGKTYSSTTVHDFG